MSLRRSKIKESPRKGGHPKGTVLPHVKACQEEGQRMMNAPATVTVAELEAEGYTHDIVYKNKTGAPTKMTYILAEEICRRIAKGELLKRICNDPHIPDAETIRMWALKNDWFRGQYSRAMTLRVEKMAEEIMEISDDGYNDYVEYEDYKGKTKIGPDQDHIRRSELRVQTRKWLMSKLAPKKYGEKLEHTGPDGGAIQHAHAVQVHLPHNGRDIIDVVSTNDE